MRHAIRAYLGVPVTIAAASIAVWASSQQPAPTAPRIIFIDAAGQEIQVPGESDPRPTVTLDPIARQDVQLLGPSEARVRVSGTVTDPIADIVANRAADITEVEVIGGNERFRVTRVAEAATPERPFAFKGRFFGTANIGLPAMIGNDRFAIQAKNAVGGTGTAAVELTIEKQFQQRRSVTTGSLHALKSLDPWTLTIAPLRADVPDTAILYLGSRVPAARQTRLTETGPDTRTFAGQSAQLGDVSLVVPATIPGDPAALDSLTVTLNSSLEVVLDQEMQFRETAPSSGVFRTHAKRLPNDAMALLNVSTPLNDRAVDVIRIQTGGFKAFFGLEPMRATVSLRETGASTRTFEGSVPGLGQTRIVVAGIVDGFLELTIDSSTAGVNGYWMALDGDPQAGQFLIDADVPRQRFEIPPAGRDTATLVAITPRDSYPPSVFNPVWIVAPDITTVGPADYAEIDGSRLSLTTTPVPRRTTPTPQARIAVPVVLVEDVGALRAPNVLASREAPRDLLGPPQRVREHTITIHIAGGR